MTSKVAEFGFLGRDWVRVEHFWNSGLLVLTKVQAKGSLTFLRSNQQFVRDIHNQSKEDLANKILSSDLRPLHRELLEKILEVCHRPYTDEELCHCRVVPTLKVIESLHYGAVSVSEVARITSAGTGCGTCQSETTKLIQHYK